MWGIIAVAYFGLIAWSAYSVIRDEAYWDGYQKGLRDGLEIREIHQKILRRFS